MKQVLLFCLLSCHLSSNGQNWSAWISIKGSADRTIQYCYKLTPTYNYNPGRVRDGNSFSFKIKNNSLLAMCGKFKVVLNLTNGQKREEFCSFKNLASGTQRSCPGVYEFGGIASLSAITDIDIGTCQDDNEKPGASTASLNLDYHSDDVKSATLTFVDPKGQYSFETRTSSGHNNAANNPYTQQFKKSPDPPKLKNGKPVEGYGTIPSGTWYITGIKNAALQELILTPGSDVINPNGRNGFLIHGYITTPADASTGCIILEKSYREKLMKAFLRDGKIQLKIKNRVY